MIVNWFKCGWILQIEVIFALICLQKFLLNGRIRLGGRLEGYCRGRLLILQLLRIPIVLVTRLNLLG